MKFKVKNGNFTTKFHESQIFNRGGALRALPGRVQKSWKSSWKDPKNLYNTPVIARFTSVNDQLTLRRLILVGIARVFTMDFI